ncbi:MAG: HAD family hydrolase [Methanotrichaceae archaeon]|nr:HAD family hydrolase [Methanotrichaceae archaeon]
MANLEELGYEGIKGVIFDCYNTLINISTDEGDISSYKPVARWLIYQGVRVSPEELMAEYRRGVKEYMESRWEAYPEVRVEAVWGKICERHAVWEIDSEALGKETSRTFRAATLERLQPFPQSERLLQELNDYPKAIVSNGQRVFSELELRYLGFYDRFEHVIFSSDFGHKKPDPRIFLEAARKLDLEPEELLAIGDNFDNDIVPAARIGMKTLHIEEAWKRFNVL